MLSLDTNILLRYVLNDNEKLSPKAKDIISSNVCHVPLLSLVELGFVLSSFYEVKTADLVQTVRSLMQIKTLRFDQESRILQALQGIEDGIDWFDAMLWVSVPEKNELGTMDKKFASKAKKLDWQPAVQSQL